MENERGPHRRGAPLRWALGTLRNGTKWATSLHDTRTSEGARVQAKRMPPSR